MLCNTQLNSHIFDIKLHTKCLTNMLGCKPHRNYLCMPVWNRMSYSFFPISEQLCGESLTCTAHFWITVRYRPSYNLIFSILLWFRSYFQILMCIFLTVMSDWLEIFPHLIRRHLFFPHSRRNLHCQALVCDRSNFVNVSFKKGQRENSWSPSLSLSLLTPPPTESLHCLGTA